MSVTAVDFARKRILGTLDAEPAAETRDQIVRRCTLERCESLGYIPTNIAQFHANRAAQIARKRPTQEPSRLVDDAVRAAIADARSTDPTTPFAA